MMSTRIFVFASFVVVLAVASLVPGQSPEVALGERINTRWSVVRYPRNQRIHVTFKIVLPEAPPPPGNCPDCPEPRDSGDTFIYADAEVTIKDTEMEIDLRLQRLAPHVTYYLYAVNSKIIRRLMEIETDNEGKMGKKQTWPSGDVIDTFMLVMARNDNLQTFGPDTPVTLVSDIPPGLRAFRRPQ